ncbi:cyclin-C [Vairimorpha necatrix]|uniref:Cyclin-C n=1 Tax=Vairimorpha necatrix TaxID=6039 RepID=A0AAX4J9N3_9MICR
MENIFKNDIKEGNKIILLLSESFKSPIKQVAISQIIFQHTYPTFFKRESHSLIALDSFFIAGKITENVIKLHVLLEAFYKMYNIKFPLEKTIFIESRMVEMCQFNFDIIPVHLYVQSICKDLEFESEAKLELVSEIHNDNRVNYINYINGIYDPEMVSVATFSDKEIDIFEVVYHKDVDRKVIREIRKLLFKDKEFK